VVGKIIRQVSRGRFRHRVVGTSERRQFFNHAIRDQIRTGRSAFEKSVPHPIRLAFSVRETADMLGLSEITVRRFVLGDLLRASRALRHHRTMKHEIERFLRETGFH